MGLAAAERHVERDTAVIDDLKRRCGRVVGDRDGGTTVEVALAVFTADDLPRQVGGRFDLGRYDLTLYAFERERAEPIALDGRALRGTDGAKQHIALVVDRPTG